MLQKLARQTASLIGRDSAPIRSLRPFYENLLDQVSGGKGVEQRVNGVPFRIDPRCRAWFPETYDPPMAALLSGRVRPGAISLNVGANLGIYTLQLAHWSRPGGRVIAFEPNPAARQMLARHVKLNGFEDRVEIVPYAVAAAPGRSTFYAAEANGMSRLGAPNREIAGSVREIPVEVTTLDRFCAERGIVPGVLVMDVEGFEIAALQGAASLIAERRQALTIAVEMHPAAWEVAGTTRQDAERLLASLQLEVKALTGQSDALAEYGQVELAWSGFANRDL